MENQTIKRNEKKYATLLHLSVFTKYFIPFGNFVMPIILWSTKKGTSDYIDYNGKQVLNFQLSILTYSLLLLIFAVPLIVYFAFNSIGFKEIENGNILIQEIAAGNIPNLVIVAAISVSLYAIMKLAEFFIIIYEAIKANNGEPVEYPFTINYLK